MSSEIFSQLYLLATMLTVSPSISAFSSFLSNNHTLALIDEMCFLLQNMYAQLLPLALPAPPMPGMGGAPGMGGYAPPGMGGMGMPPMPPFGMPPMGSSY
jgi:hypothetical protein